MPTSKHFILRTQSILLIAFPAAVRDIRGCFTVRSHLNTDCYILLMIFLVREGDDEPHLNCFKGRPGEISQGRGEILDLCWLLPFRFKEM
jgi:hypothetical protein